MTRDERKELIKHLKYNRSIGADYLITDKDADEIIKALEQQTCEDCVSRQAAIDTYKNLRLPIYPLEELPPVKPEQKIGRWVEHFDKSGKWYECDQCHTDWGGTVNYCPNCGAKMEGEA